MHQFILTLCAEEHLSPAAADIDSSAAACPVEQKEQFRILLQQYGPTCFEERGKFPPDRGPENLFGSIWILEHQRCSPPYCTKCPLG